MKVDLKPCPFCGPGKSVVELWKDEFQYWKVTCGACGSSSGILPDTAKFPDARQRVIDGWNKRYYDEPVDAGTRGPRPSGQTDGADAPAKG